MSTITVTPTVELDSNPPRVRLDVSDADLPAHTETTVVRLDSSGRTSPVRTADGNPLTLTTSGANRIGTVYDYEAPYGSPVSYSTVEDPASVSAQVTIDVAEVWLVHPGVPELSRPVTVAEFGPRSYAAERGVFRPMGRRYPVVHTDGQRKAAEYMLTLRTDTLTEYAALMSLTSDMGDLLLNVPESLGFGITAEYVSVDTLVESRFMEYAADRHRYWDLPCTVVDRPAGGTQAERTYADLLVFSSYADLQAAYGDYQSLLSGP
jgi:hypothetical protein